MTDLIKVEDLFRQARLFTKTAEKSGGKEAAQDAEIVEKMITSFVEGNTMQLITCEECDHYAPYSHTCKMMDAYREPDHLCTEGEADED